MTVVGSPTLHLVEQYAEREADRFSIELNRDSGGMAAWMMFVAKSKSAVIEYYPFYRLYRATHPSTADEVRLANSWRPWEQGQPGRYDALCDGISPERSVT